MRKIQELSSPVDALLAERCDEHRDHSVPKDDLYDSWRAWCERYSHRPGTKGDLTRLLATARPGSIKTGKPGTDERIPSYLGLRLKPAAGPHDQYDGRGYWEK